MNNKEIKLAAKENLKGRFGTTFLAEVATAAIIFATNIIPFGTILVAGALNVGKTNVYVKGGNQEKISIKDLFFGFTENFGENFLSGILKGVFILFWTMLFIIPGIVKCFSYAMMEYILARDTDLSAMEAIKKSKELMHGHKMELLLLDLSFIGWYVLDVITFGIACIYTVPYINAAKTEFFKRIYEN